MGLASLPCPFIDYLQDRPTRPTPTTRQTTCHPISCTSIYKPPTVRLPHPRPFDFSSSPSSSRTTNTALFPKTQTPLLRTEAHELPRTWTTQRATCAIRHHVSDLHVRRAHLSQRGRRLRRHCLPVLQLRQPVGACRQAEPVVHLLLHSGHPALDEGIHGHFVPHLQLSATPRTPTRRTGDEGGWRGRCAITAARGTSSWGTTGRRMAGSAAWSAATDAIRISRSWFGCMDFEGELRLTGKLPKITGGM